MLLSGSSYLCASNKMPVITMVMLGALAACSVPFVAFAVDDQERIRYDQDGINSSVQQAVADALAMYSENGRDAFGAITRGGAPYSDAPIPLVIDSATLEIVAHGGGHAYIGETAFGVSDTPMGDVRSALERDGQIWITHMEANPENNQLQSKRALLHLHSDGYIFSAGYFLEDYEVQLLIENVVVQYETYGTDVFDMITPNAPVMTDELYPFVIDFSSWTRVADGVVPERVGQPEGILNTATRSADDVFAELRATGSAWVTYTFHNPGTDIVQLKLTWLYLHDGYVFGSGYYPLDSAAKSQVDSSVLMYAAHGTGAFGMITPDTFDPLLGQSNFVLNAATLEILAHGRSPALVGAVFEQLEAANKPLRTIMSELRTAGEGGKGVWVWHMDRNPATQTEQLTRTYLILRDGYIFGASISLPDIRVQSVADDALYTYRNDPQGSFDIVTSGSLNRADLFPVIRNATHLLAHGLVPSLIGPFDVHVARPGGGSFSDFDDGDTYWAQIAIFDATTGVTQIKRTWYVHYDGYAFLSPYTVANAGVQSVTDYARFIYESNKENDAWKNIITPDEPVVTDALYPFVIDFKTWIRVADGVVPDRVGQPDAILDTSSRSVHDVRADLVENGQVWLTYTFHNPATGVEQLKRTYLQLKDGLVFGSGYYILDSGVQTVVYSDILDYDSAGKDATLEAIGTVPDKPVTTYAFAVDPDAQTTVAQGVDAALIDVPDWDAITAVLSTRDILSMTRDAPGMWASYLHKNPVTGDKETKRTWLVHHDGLILGAGYYASDIPESDVKFAVSNAINIYNNNKDDNKWADIITPDEPITTDALYPFVIDFESWTRVADGVVPARVGQPETILDTSTRTPADVLAELNDRGSLWVSYIFHNPATDVEQLKRSYLRLHEGLVFGSGYYVLDSRVQSATHSRIQEYERDGRDAALASINTAPEAIISTYSFAVDPATDETLAQGASRAATGVTADWDAITAAHAKQDVLSTLGKGAGAWFSYEHTSPISGEPELKYTWLVLHDGIIFGTGYYSSDIPATDVTFVVQNAIDIYDENRDNNAWADIITPDSPITTDALYPFVIDADTWTRLADGVVPARVGQPETILDTSTRTPADVLAELNDRGSLWVSYIFHNPATDVEQLKRSYLRLHEGLVFGSGYYVLDSQVQSSVHSRILEYERDGRASAIQSIGTVPPTPVSTYAFVVDSGTGETLAQNVDTGVVGTAATDWSAIAGAYSESDVLDRLGRGSGDWVSYTHASPVTGEPELKHAWLVLHDGLVFGAGHYSTDIWETDVKFEVRGAIGIYEDNKADDAWRDIITPDRQLTTDALYPFVIDADTWIRLADGVVPARVGQPETILDTSTRTPADVLAELNDRGSLWVSYIFHNPATDVEQLKRSYLRLHEGLVFGSGYYVLESRAQSLTHSLVLEHRLDGRDAVIDSVTAGDAGSLYSFVVDSASDETLAQGADPADTGATADWSAILQAVPKQDLLGELGRGSGVWVGYIHTSPTTGEPEAKRTWLTLDGGLVFGTGYYSSDIRSELVPGEPYVSPGAARACR